MLPFLSEDSPYPILQATVGAFKDYANAWYLPSSSISQLQMVQNSAAKRLLTMPTHASVSGPCGPYIVSQITNIS